MKKFFELINNNLQFFQNLEKLQKKYTSTELPLITISREKGSGGRYISFLVEKKLGNPWKVYNKQIVEEIAKEAHLEKELVSEVDEVKISFIDSFIDDIFGKRYMTLSTYYRHLVKILTTIGTRGYAIITGRGANFLLPHALKIRIICDMQMRIDNLIKHEHMTKKQAMRVIETSDKQRAEFTKTLFNHSIDKEHHYDIVIKTSRELSIEDAADIIVLEAKKRFSL